MLLATVELTLSAPHGQPIQVRGLIVPGSEANFIAESFVQKLGATSEETSVSVCVIGGNPTALSRRKTTLRITARHELIDTTFYILPLICIKTPSHDLPGSEWRQFLDLD